MERKTLISVIVPVYKVEKYLSQCVDSILNQTYRNLELILVDDGSPDGCGKLCDAYAEKDGRVRVVHKKNGGLSDARNAGINAASGDYLSFIDGDDWIEPDTYAAMLAAAEKYSAALVCAGRYDEDEETGIRTVGLCPKREEQISSKEMVRRIFHWEAMDSSACDKLYARHLFEGIRFPLGMVCEDVPTTYRVVLRAEKAVLLPKPVYHYRHRASSITTSAVSEKSFHFSRHAAMIYEDIKRNVPELEPDARYLLVCALRYNVELLEHASAEMRKCFREENLYSRRKLRANLKFAFQSGFFTKKQQLKIALAACGVYGTAMRVFHFPQRLKYDL